MWIKPFKISKVCLWIQAFTPSENFLLYFPLHFFFLLLGINVFKKLYILVSMAVAFKYGPPLNMRCSYPAHLRGTCLIGFNYYCLWSSLKRSKKGSVANADPHGFLHTLCALSPVHACTHTRNPPRPSHRSTLSHTHITSPTVRLQIANQGDSIDLQTTARERERERHRERERATVKEGEKKYVSKWTVSGLRLFVSCSSLLLNSLL